MKKNGIEGPLSISIWSKFFFFHAIFWLFPVILFLKGECNVPPKISVTLKKEKKNPTKQTNQQQQKKPLWGPWRKFYPFKCISKLAILLYFVIFHRREKWSLHDHIKEVWSNRKTGASARTQPGCPVASCSPSGSTWQLLPIALGGSDEVCVCVKCRQPEVPSVWKPSCLCTGREALGLQRISLSKKIITFIHGTLWADFPLYAMLSSMHFCAFIEYKNRSPLKFCFKFTKKLLVCEILL